MKKPLIFNIQRYSIHDGEGIRTTVFFKGCPLSCRWCHNPESQRYQKELMLFKDRCTGCGACVKACTRGAVSISEDGVRTDRGKCGLCLACLDVCVNNAREAAGREYELDELLDELEKDKMFYEESGGGITLSGGEVLGQDMDYVEGLAKRLYHKGYSVDIDTCGYVPYEHIRRILPWTDTFLYDIKLMDPEEHKKYTGVDNALILENLKRLSCDGGRINIRIPLIGGVNADDGFIGDVIRFIRENHIFPCRVNLLKYHDTGRGKYGRLERTYECGGMAVPSQEWMEHAVELFRQSGCDNIHIGG